MLAKHPKHFTTSWAQHIVNQHCSDTLVKDVKVSSIDIGTTTRVFLTVDHTGPETLARHWFIKIPSLNLRARAITALPRLLHTEVRFYNELARHTPINKPTVLSAKSIFGRGSTLVLNNISKQGAKAGKPGDSLSAEQASKIVEQLANLHACFWNKTHNAPQYNWLCGPVRRLEDHLGTALAVPLMKRGLSKANNLVPKALHTPALAYARQRRKAMHFLSDGPQTLTHHDCHPGNLFWDKNDNPGLLDWQMVRVGEGISDIAYLLATSLTPEIRRNHENDLVNQYIATLNNHKDLNIDSKALKQKYRAHLIYPFEAMVVTLAVGGMMDLQANLELIKRAAAAIEDNHAFDALPIN